MKNIIISSLFAASLTFAGVINIQQASSTSRENISQIDKISFTGGEDAKSMTFSGKTSQKAIGVSDIDSVKFEVLKKSAETMKVKVDSGIYQGVIEFKLGDVSSIVFEEEDDETDSDGDGLTDLKEVYFYGTNPQSVDTDGDGWDDREEVVEKFSASNPTVFNARIADVPALEIVATKTPVITLNITTDETTTSSETISEGKDVSLSNTVSYESSRSSDLMNGWSFSTSHGWEIGAESKYVGNVSLGYNGSFTSSTGTTWGSDEQRSVANSYETTLAREKSENKNVSGATLCMQVSLKNTGSIAYTIKSLKLNAVVYDVNAQKSASTLATESSMAIIADLDREGGFSATTLAPGKSVEANFCNGNVALQKIEKLINNSGAIFLGSASQEITIGSDDDFTTAYTNVAAKTADITIDYGPGATNKEIEHFRVSTRFKYNPAHKGTDDMYEKVSLAEILDISRISYTQDSVKSPSGKNIYGLVAIDNFKFNLADSAWWFVSVQKAADVQKNNNQISLYALPIGNFDLNKIYIDAGDVVQIFYSIDQDNDGLPARTERLVGSSDAMEDTDGDGLTDYEEVVGWSRYDDEGKFVAGPFHTNPSLKDTDGDGVNDKEDDDPNARTLFGTAEISSIVVKGYDDGDSTVVLTKTSVSAIEKTSTIKKAYAHVAFKLKDPVRTVNVSHKSGKTVMSTAYIKPAADNVSYEYSSQTPLSLVNTDTLIIKILSENEKDSNTYKIALPSALAEPTDLKLGKNAERTSIIGSFDLSKDSRVQGYMIVRGVGTYTKYSKGTDKVSKTFKDNDKIGAKSMGSRVDLPLNDADIGDGLIVIDRLNSDKNQFSDNVGAGTEYYSYRVYSYTKEGNKYIFSTGSNVKTRSVGRILMKFKLDSLNFISEVCFGTTKHCDVNWKMSLMGSTKDTLYKFQEFRRTGTNSSTNKYSYETANNELENDITDTVDFYYNVGSDGFNLVLDVKADGGSYTAHEITYTNFKYSTSEQLCRTYTPKTAVAGDSCLAKDGTSDIRLSANGHQQGFIIRSKYGDSNEKTIFIDDDAGEK